MPLILLLELPLDVLLPLLIVALVNHLLLSIEVSSSCCQVVIIAALIVLLDVGLGGVLGVQGVLNDTGQFKLLFVDCADVRDTRATTLLELVLLDQVVSDATQLGIGGVEKVR